jgi:hypothetical protein
MVTAEKEYFGEFGFNRSQEIYNENVRGIL